MIDGGSLQNRMLGGYIWGFRAAPIGLGVIRDMS